MLDEPRELVSDAVDECLTDLECLLDDLTCGEGDLNRSDAGDVWVVLRMVIRRLQSVEGLVEPARGGRTLG